MTIADDASPPAAANAVHGHRSTLVSQAVRLGCKAVSVVVVARLLTPADHGLFAMAASVFLFLFLFRDLGLGTAIVQAPTLESAHLASLFWAHALLGGAFTLVAIALAPLTGALYGADAAGRLLAAMAPVFVCIGIGGLPRALLARALRFRKLNFVETTGAVVGTLAMIGAALAGAGPWTFVIFLAVSEIMVSVLAWRAAGVRLGGRPAWAHVRSFGRTGVQLTGFHTLNYLLTQLDTFAVGRLFGPAALGLYSRTGQLIGLTNVHVAGPLTQVALAALSRVQTEAGQFHRDARTTITTVAHLTLPAAAVCAALPDEMVRLVLGPQWPDAAPMLRWLAINTGVGAATSLAYGINVAAGQARRLAWAALVSLPLTCTALLVGAGTGPTGVAAALAGVNVVLAVPRLWWMLRGTPLGVRDYVGALCVPLAVALALGGGLVLGRALAAEGAALWGRLVPAAAGGATALGAIALGWPRVRDEWRVVWAHLPLTKPPTA